MKKTLTFLIISLLLIFIKCACESNNILGHKDADTVLETAEADYSSDIDENTPEYIAKLSSITYQNMIKGSISTEKGYEILLDISSKESVAQMKAQKYEFLNQIKSTGKYFEANGMEITGYDFSRTYYDENNGKRASIYRIQNMNNGKKYYFRQDFILEDGMWKLRGDNLVNNFAILLY